ncbi:hypothetical protein ACXHXM_32295
MDADRDDAFLASASCLPKGLERDPDVYCLNWLLEEVSTSINTAPAGGNPSLVDRLGGSTKPDALLQAQPAAPDEELFSVYFTRELATMQRGVLEFA